MDSFNANLSKLYANTEAYILQIAHPTEAAPIVLPLSHFDTQIIRSNDAISLIINQRFSGCRNEINLTIPTEQSRLEFYKDLTAKIIASESPLLSFGSLEKVTCQRSRSRFMPIIADAIVQHLPVGELLSEAVDGTSPRILNEINAAIVNLEEFIRQSRFRFDTLLARDIILGEDGRLYPFRYEGLSFNCERDPEQSLAECDILRKDVEKISGHSLSQMSHTPDKKLYNESLCDTYMGYIERRETCDDRIAVLGDDGWGFVDQYGQVVVETKYMSVSDFSHGQAVVQLTHNELFGIIDTMGEYIQQPIYFSIEMSESDNTIKLHKKHSTIVINRDGEVL